MACLSHHLVCLLVVVISLNRSEFVDTRVNRPVLRQKPKPSSRSNTNCFRLCRSMTNDQEKLRNSTLEKCIQNCKLGSSKDEDGHVRPKLRMQRSVEEKRKRKRFAWNSQLKYEITSPGVLMEVNRDKCVFINGVSDNNCKWQTIFALIQIPIQQVSERHRSTGCLGLSHPLAPTPKFAKFLNVKFKSIAVDRHSYRISWEPLIYAHNWTHYSLLYYFELNQTPDGMPNCVLVPKNVTNWTVVDHAPNTKPDVIHFAIVSFPFRGPHGESVPFENYDPLRPTFIPTFIPVFETKEPATRPIAWAPIAGGSAAGVVLLVILLMAIMWRRRSVLCPSNYQDPVMQAVVSRPNNIKERATDRKAVAASLKADICSELYYSCYYPENEAFRGKVASIVNFFRKNGYDVIMDAMVSSELSSQGPARWAENQIRKAKKVLVFLSPGLLKLASADGCEGNNVQDINRVWIELEVLRDLYSQNRSASKMVCITFPDLPVTSQDVPVWLKVSYKWPQDVREILKRLNDRPSIEPLK